MDLFADNKIFQFKSWVPRTWWDTSLIFAVGAVIFLSGCGPSKLEYSSNVSSKALIFHASATAPVFDGTDLKSTVTVSVKNWRGEPISGYNADIELDQVSTSGILSKIKSLFSLSNSTLSAQIICGTTNQLGIATCDLTVAPPTVQPQQVNLKVGGQTVGLSSPLIVYPAPTVTAVSDSTLSFDQGQNLTVTGTQFRVGMNIYLDAALCTPVTVLSTTTAQCTTPIHALGGPYDVIVLTDDQQQASLVGAVSFQDATVPQVTLTAVPPSRSNQSSFSFTFTGSDNYTLTTNLVFHCRLNNDSWDVCTSPYVATGFNDGLTHIFSVRVTDQAGLTNEAATAWIYDSTAPTVTVANQSSLSPSPSSSLAARTVTLGGADIVKYKYLIINSGNCSAVDFSGLTEFSFSPAPTISFTPSTEGEYTLCAIGQDEANNWQADSAATSSATLVIDTHVVPFSGLVVTPSSPNNVTMPTLTGVSEPGANLTLYKQASCVGAALANASVNSVGTFSLTPSSSIGVDGTYAFSVKAIDAAGNTLCSSPVPYVLDTDSPNLAFTTAANSRGTNQISLSGICETGLDVVISGTGALSSTSVVCAGNSFTHNVSLSANGGTKNIVLTSTDLAGNVTTVNRDFVRDDTLPLLVITSPVADFRSTGSVTLTGTCGIHAYDLPTLTIVGSGLATSPQSQACSAGSYSINLTLSSGDGAKSISISQSDIAGNTQTLNRSFVKDTASPVLAISDPTANFRAPLGVTISGVCGNSAGDSSTVTIAGAGISGGPIAAVCTAGAFSQGISFTAGDGTKNVTVTQADDLGHSTVDNRNFIRDSTAPNLSIDSPATNTRAQSTITLSGVCGNSGDDLPTITIGGAGLSSPTSTNCSGGGTFSEVITLTAGGGDKTISVSQTNILSTTTTDTRVFVRDETAPTVTFTSPAANARSNGSLLLSGTCSAGAGDNSTLSLSGTGLSSPATTACVAGSFSETISFTAGEGTKNIVVTQTDSAGNSLSINRDFVRDDTAPTVTISSPTANTPAKTGATLTGTCTSAAGDGSTLNLSGAGLASPTTTTCVSNAYSVAITFTSGGGSKEIIVTQTDSAGNGNSATVTLIRDNTAPVVTLTSMTGGQFIKGGQNNTITWTATDAVELDGNPISLEYSLNAGTNWTTIATGQSNVGGSYTWITPGFNSSAARIRVTATDRAGNVASSSSTANFTIDSTAPLLTLDTLTGGQLVKGGANTLINWTATDSNFGSNPIALFYSSDGGTNWISITSATANDGTHTWAVPADDSNTYRVRVVAVDAVSQVTTASSTANITIDKTVPTVTLTSFTGGEAILGHVSKNITWTASDTNLGATPIALELSSDGGSTWQTIASNLPNTGSYAWPVNVNDGNSYRLRVTATDTVGWSASSASTANFLITSSAPNLTQTTLPTPYYSNSANSVGFGGSCETGLAINITGAETSSATCSPGGTWSWTTSTVASDATRDFTFSQDNGALSTSVSARWVRDTQAPAVNAVVINNGDVFTPSATVSVAVTVSESSGLKIKLANALTSGGNCPAYSDDSWQTQTGTSTVLTQIVSTGDGAKKICAWVKDLAGNHSVIASTGTPDVDVDTITHASGNPPTVTVFEVTNNAGGAFQGTYDASTNDGLKISWTVTDVEGLANNPIYLDYTTDGSTWIPIEAGFGSQSGNPTSYSADYYGFSAPGNTFFRVRLRVKDLAGNTSSEVVSKPFNSTPWSVVAGSLGRGEGGSAKSASILRYSSEWSTFAINPVNGDVYYLDFGYAWMKVSAATGLVTKFLSLGGNDIVGSGTLTPATRFNSGRMLFDNKGYLYLIVHTNQLVTAKVIRVNPETLQYTTYISGGMVIDNSATPSTVFVMSAESLAFDESNSFYFMTSCTPGSAFVEGAATTSTVRLMKVTQNPDGTAGTVSVVAGNCVRGLPVAGELATQTPFTNASTDWGVGRIAVWNNGNTIYYGQTGNNKFTKILNGISYTTAIPRHLHFAYNPVNEKIYATGGALRVYSPSLSGNDGEVEDTTQQILGTATGAGCTEDGVLPADVCANFYGSYPVPSGRVFLADGASRTPTLLRYLDDDGKIQTLAGTRSFNGAGKPHALAKGTFGGIYYKKSTEPLSAAYPEGLYFNEFNGGVFGYFDTATGLTYNLWGNQSGRAAPVAGTVVSPILSIGTNSYSAYGDLQAFTFDKLGRPWMRSNGWIMYSLDQDRKLVSHSVAGNVLWHTAPAGSNPNNYRMNRTGGVQNFTFAGNSKLFLLGTYYDNSLPVSADNDPNPRLRVFDYDNNVVTHVMGNVAAAVTPQQTGEGSLENQGLSPSCRNTGCSIEYASDQDRLYLAESATLRYITSPMDPAHHTLIDVFTASTTISNFTLSPDRKYIFYVKSGYLYCHAISAVDNSTICKNTVASHVKLGPPTGFSTITKGPNQMTWKNTNTLFISTYTGEIYEYVVMH